MELTLAPALAAIACAIATPAIADSFLPPSVQEIRSDNGQARVTIVPARLSCNGGEADCEPAARAVIAVEQGGEDALSQTARLHHFTLRNPEAPGYALVTDDGARLITVDDYASAGFGDNVLVIYDEAGEVIANYGLADFLPEDYIAGLPRTASTLRWWGERVQIVPGTHMAIVSVYRVQRDDGIGVPRTAHLPTFDLSLDLDTGELERPNGPEWDMALTCARANSWLVPDEAAEKERERYRSICRSSFVRSRL